MQRLCLVLFAALSAIASAQSPQKRVGLELFEKKIRPALIQYCYECHAIDSDDVGGRLLLDSRLGWQSGGETGEAIVPGKPGDSLLMRAIEYRDLEMPPDEKLPDEVIADFRHWISLGAPDPRVGKTLLPQDSESADATDLWSIQPVMTVSSPHVNDAAWPRTDVDRFVLAKLESNQLVPNQDTDPATLLRRVHFDLVGLPPRPDQVAAFVADPSEQHFKRVVNQLLASSQFGERWGRHWLDVARYGESAGSSRDVLMLYAWRYRDYVIDAFNRDLRFDRFITEQVAGDLLPAETAEDRFRQTVATGLLAIGSKSLNGGNLTYDIIDDQIDVVSKSVLGLTVSCARCHDHKFDPIPTKDYYSLAGIFLSTETRYGGGTKRPKTEQEKRELYLAMHSQELDPQLAAQQAAANAEVARLEKQVNASRNRVKKLRPDVPAKYRNESDNPVPATVAPKVAKVIQQFRTASSLLQQRLEALESARGKLGEAPEYLIGVRDAKKITDANVLIRGEKNQLGEVAQRGFLSAIGDRCQLREGIDDSESGRRQFAMWLVHPENPLTARVAVNRIWHHLMGSGIVETVDNFGASGTPPSHGELLDYLAGRFIHQHHWSTKAMIRELVLSRTYRLSSAMNEESFQADPDNRLRWRMPRRRLQAEPLRDAMLSVSGLLDPSRPQGSLVLQIGEGEVGRNLDTSVLDQPFDHRSVYLPIIRGIIPEPLKLFDFPEPSNVQGQRDSNTTPTQSLFLMNSRFTLRVAENFARQLLSDPSLNSDADRIRSAHARCFAATATPAQIERDQRFIDEMLQRKATHAADQRQVAWTAYCQSLVASAKFRFID